jgi:hypothetical protein
MKKLNSIMIMIVAAFALLIQPLTFLAAAKTYAKSAPMFSGTPVYRLRNYLNHMNLTQAYLGQMGENGTHEVGREAVVAPEQNFAGVNWLIQDGGNGYGFIINRESGLLLSTNGANHLVQVYQRLLLIFGQRTMTLVFNSPDSFSGTDWTGVAIAGVRQQQQQTQPQPQPAQANSANPVLGRYDNGGENNGWNRGSIVEESGSGGRLRWTNELGVSWSLVPDYANGVLRTDDSNPYQRVDYTISFSLLNREELPGFSLVWTEPQI